MLDVKANIRALEGAVSEEFIQYLLSEMPTSGQLIGAPGGWNVIFNGTAFYPESAEKYVSVQLDAFLKVPTRRISFAASNFLFDEDQTGSEDDPSAFTPRPLNAEKLCRQLPRDGERIAGDFAKSILRFVDGVTLDWFPSEDAGHLIVFGLGLGVHIESLVSSLPIKTLIIVDYNPEFLKLSLQTVDWVCVRRTLEKRGGGLRIQVSNSAAALSNFIENEMRNTDFPRIDGAYIFKHYDLGPMVEAVQRMQEAHATIENSKGFFEDELIMVHNAGRNLQKLDFCSLHDLGRMLTESPGSAVIIGSGPSIDDNIEDIKRLCCEGASLFASGTAVRIALAAGLTPHFVCEIENNSEITESMKLVASEFDLRKCVLLASATVDPELSKFFDKTILYHRDGLTSTSLFADLSDVLSMSGPTVANLACRAAIALGFKQLILFGVDLGTASRDQHHSSETVYATSDSEYWRDGAEMEPLVFPVKGNHRKTVYTSSQFLLTRAHFEQLFWAASQLPEPPEIINVSDGAFIEGAVAARGKQVSLRYQKDPPTDFSAIIDKLMLKQEQAAEILPKVTGYKDSCLQWSSTVQASLSNLSRSGAVTIDEFVDAMSSQPASNDVMRLGCDALRGSLLSMAQIAYVICRRLQSEEHDECVRAACESAIFQLKEADKKIQTLIV